jgi:hypothetical protein
MKKQDSGANWVLLAAMAIVIGATLAIISATASADTQWVNMTSGKQIIVPQGYKLVQIPAFISPDNVCTCQEAIGEKPDKSPYGEPLCEPVVPQEEEEEGGRLVVSPRPLEDNPFLKNKSD